MRDIICDCGQELLLEHDDTECDCGRCYNIFGQQLKSHAQRDAELPQNDI